MLLLLAPLSPGGAFLSSPAAAPSALAGLTLATGRSTSYLRGWTPGSARMRSLRGSRDVQRGLHRGSPPVADRLERCHLPRHSLVRGGHDGRDPREPGESWPRQSGHAARQRLASDWHQVHSGSDAMGGAVAQARRRHGGADQGRAALVLTFGGRRSYYGSAGHRLISCAFSLAISLGGA
jgi:hypothetical protein